MRIVDDQTVEVSASFDEPVASADGSALGDLAYHNVWYRYSTNPPVKGPQLPASSPSGGGKVLNAPLLVPAPAGQRTPLEFWVRSVDLSGNMSPESTHVVFDVDRVAPAAPSNFMIA